MLETIVMYFILQHMQGQKVNNVGAWNDSIKLEMQLNYNYKYLPMLPTILPIHSCLLIRGMMFFK
jgi:hypothetical protein